MKETTFQRALEELEGLTRFQQESEAREDWSSSLDRLQEEEAAVSRLLAAAASSAGGGRKQLPSEVSERLDALLASYGDRLSRIELHKRQNRQELASLGKKRDFAIAALQLYSKGEN